jgi:hypothetical protein
VESIGFSYGILRLLMFQLSALPPELQCIPLCRTAEGAAAWTAKRAMLDYPQASRYETWGVFPVAFLDDMLLLPDGSLLAGLYPGYRLRNDGTFDSNGEYSSTAPRAMATTGMSKAACPAGRTAPLI